MRQLKKVLFYSLQSFGHLNVCASIGSLLLDGHPDELEVWFVLPAEWAQRLAKVDHRFKFALIESDQQAGDYIVEAVKNCRKLLELPAFEREIRSWVQYLENKQYLKIDEKSEEKIREIQPDLVLCDQVIHLPAMHSTGIPFAFIHSSSPSVFEFEGFPMMGSDVSVYDEKGIREEAAKCHKVINPKIDYEVKRNFEIRDVEIPRDVPNLARPVSNLFNVYVCPEEIDIYDSTIQEQHRLWRFDTPLFDEKVPKPFELPAEFRELPEKKVVYVSLGSLFSQYTDLLQRLVDALEKVPDCKFIISKGPNGDRLRFPSKRFIGANFLNQLAVLQVCDAMIAHGGHNTLGECFYFGVPCLILPAFSDQVNNAQRITETGFGYKLDLLNYEEQELADKLNKILYDKELRLKWRAASKRIQSENRIVEVVDRIANYVLQQ